MDGGGLGGVGDYGFYAEWTDLVVCATGLGDVGALQEGLGPGEDGWGEVYLCGYQLFLKVTLTQCLILLTLIAYTLTCLLTLPLPTIDVITIQSLNHSLAVCYNLSYFIEKTVKNC